MQEVCQLIRVVFCLLPYNHLCSFTRNFMYNILLYKHVFGNMYALCLYHAVCYLPPPFPDMILYHFCYPSPLLFTLVPISLSFFPSLPVFHPDHDIMMQGQSEEMKSTYPMKTIVDLQGLIKAGIRVLFFPSQEIVEQRCIYLLDLNDNIDLSVTCCTAGLHVNRHRDDLYHRLSFPHHLGDFTEELAGLLTYSWQ